MGVRNLVAWLNRLLVCAAVVAAVGCFSSAQDAPNDPKRRPAGASEVTKEHLRTKVPNFFYFDYDFEPHPGKRLWLRVDDRHFVERYPSGLESKFKVLGRARVDGTDGTIVVKVSGDAKETGTDNEGGFQVFLPDRGSEKMEIRFRHAGQGGDWAGLWEMKKVE